MLVVEQNALVAAEATDRAYVLRHGEIILEQDANALLANPHLASAYLG